MNKDRLLNHVYFVDSSRPCVLVPFVLDGIYGVATLPVIKLSQQATADIIDKPHWRYSIKRVNGSHVIEMVGRLELFHGRLSTPKVWRCRVTRCVSQQVPLIVDWVKELNGEVDD